MFESIARSGFPNRYGVFIILAGHPQIAALKTHHFFVIGYIVRRLSAKIQNYTVFVETDDDDSDDADDDNRRRDDVDDDAADDDDDAQPQTSWDMSRPKPQTAAPLPNIDSLFYECIVHRFCDCMSAKL